MTALFVLAAVGVGLAAVIVLAWPALSTAPWRPARAVAVIAALAVLAGVALVVRDGPNGPVATMKPSTGKPAPTDGEGWARLGRSLASAGRFEEAAAAFAEADRRLPRNAGILADRADTLAMSRGRRFDGEPDRLIAQALEADPRHVKALALSGSSAFRRGDFAVAARQWRTLLPLLPPQGDMAREVAESLREAERRSGAAP